MDHARPYRADVRLGDPELFETLADVTAPVHRDRFHLTFASDAPVYPMRLSRLAATPQSLRLYVLAAHRVRPESTIGGEPPRVAFAGDVAAMSADLGGLADGTPYLTAIDQEFPQPDRISGDHTLRRAANDAPYREVIHQDRLMKAGGLPVYLLVLGAGFAVLVVGVVLGLLWWRSRRAVRRVAEGR